jgi:hypothetical protein
MNTEAILLKTGVWVPNGAVSLQGGLRSRLKRVEVTGLDGAEARRRLLALAD